MFAKWLFDPTAGYESKSLSWDTFDPGGHAAAALKQRWFLSNAQLFMAKCRLAPEGSSMIPQSELSNVSSVFHNSEHKWISYWKGQAYLSPSSSGVSLDKECNKCVFSYHLQLLATDTSDFNPGEKFGNLGLLTKDDTWIWVRDHTPLGHDYNIYAFTSEFGEWEYEYGE